MERRTFISLATAGLVGGAPLSKVLGAEDALPLDLATLYETDGSGGLNFAPHVLAAVSRLVVVTGYVAPHLQPGAPFHLVSHIPLSACPHCLGNRTLPKGTVAFYPLRANGASYEPGADPVALKGYLELGAKVDPQTGFVTTIRLRGTSLPTV